mmetsp:Transcript_5240/g.14832  ORF Transcript_5240/g.14832 Transcript_5240/m.14832 type:complete len:140 (+) Transcript_5240:27-446(+)
MVARTQKLSRAPRGLPRTRRPTAADDSAARGSVPRGASDDGAAGVPREEDAGASVEEDYAGLAREFRSIARECARERAPRRGCSWSSACCSSTEGLDQDGSGRAAAVRALARSLRKSRECKKSYMCVRLLRKPEQLSVA